MDEPKTLHRYEGHAPTRRLRGAKDRPRRLVNALCWIIALEFFVWAPLKFLPNGFLGYPSYPEKFVAWGYPAWFSFLVGGGEVLAAILLVLPRRRFVGAVILAGILDGAIVTHIINQDSFVNSISAPLHLAAAIVVALGTWPRAWSEPFALARRP